VQDRLPAVTQDTRCDPLCEQRRPAGQIYIGCLGECAIRAPPYHYIADASCDRRALHRYAVISAQAIDEHVGFAASNVMMERLYVINYTLRKFIEVLLDISLGSSSLSASIQNLEARNRSYSRSATLHLVLENAFSSRRDLSSQCMDEHGSQTI